MKTPLLATKLYIPPLRHDLVARERLIEQLNTGLTNKLALISAPAGFGKTTLVCSWIKQVGQDVAWLSLDEGDNDPTRFLSYFVASLQTINGDIGQDVLAALKSPGVVKIEVVLTTLLNELTDYPGGVVFVLDDYHVIESPPIDQALTYLLDHLPANIQLVISSRIDPTFPLPRLRARGRMTEVRAHDLRFTANEAAAFLNQVLDFNLSDQDIVALENRTEGWIAGLQLAALSLKGLSGSSDIAEFINRFTGSDRYIHDYLVDEVLHKQPIITNDFLLQTSILKQLNAPLCDSVTGEDKSQAILEELEASNLFIQPLDNKRHWYRYHHLFADLLSHKLNLKYPDMIPDLHLRASSWYESNGYIDEAVHHAFAADSNIQLAEILEKHWQDIVHRGEMTRLMGWLDALGPDITSASAPLSMAYCWIHVMTATHDPLPGHLRNAKEALKNEPTLEDGHRPPMHLAVIPSLIETMEATIALDNKQPEQAKAHALKAISLIPNSPNPSIQGLLQGAAGFRLALAHKGLGEYEQACGIFLQGLEMLKSSENYFGVAVTVWQVVTIYQVLGKIEAAFALCDETLDYIKKHHLEKMPPSGVVHLVLAGLQADSGDLESASKNLELGRELVAQMKTRHVRSMINSVEEVLDNSAPSPQPLVEPISPRELEVLQLVAEGLSNREIGERLFLALDTVKGHNRNIYSKLGVKNRTQAANKAIAIKILPPK